MQRHIQQISSSTMEISYAFSPLPISFLLSLPLLLFSYACHQAYNLATAGGVNGNDFLTKMEPIFDRIPYVVTPGTLKPSLTPFLPLIYPSPVSLLFSFIVFIDFDFFSPQATTSLKNMETPSTTRIGSADKHSSASSQAASILPCGLLSMLEMSISLLYVFAPSYPFPFSSLKHLVVPILDEQSGSPNPIITFAYTSLSSPTPIPFLRSPSLPSPSPSPSPSLLLTSSSRCPQKYTAQTAPISQHNTRGS